MFWAALRYSPGPASRFRPCSIILKRASLSTISLRASQRRSRPGHCVSRNGQRPVDRNDLVRVLLDECVDRRLAHELHGHEVQTVTGLGWAGVLNGALLAQATGEFDAFVTVDRNLAFQQRIDNLALAVVILRARS